MSINEYLNQPYKRSFTLINEEGTDYWYGCIQELNGCCATAATKEQCDIKLTEALTSYIENKIKAGEDIPKTDGNK